MSQVRNPAVAGYFYPADPVKLSGEIDYLLSTVEKKEVRGRLYGIVSPHAGYAYSGKTAAFGFKLLEKKSIKTVIIISPSHREYFPGISVYEGDAYKTPLGTIPVNKEAVNVLVSKAKTIFKGTEGHREEHAIEVQLPFLQSVLSGFEIVPVVMGDQGKPYIDELAEKLAETAGEDTLIISSSDLSHYYPGDVANKMDSIVEREMNLFNYDGLFEDFESRRCEACGAGTIIAMMKSADELRYNRSLVLHRSDSGDTTGNKEEVVGYLSAAIYGD